MSELGDGLGRVLEEIVSYRSTLDESPVAPSVTRAATAAALPKSLPSDGAPLATVIDELTEIAGP
ncbi:MAG: hypothetical protein ABFR53_12845, partial [Actinomycetota bacterium]